MPERIDIMTLPIDQSPFFDVDTSGVDFVNIQWPIGVNKRANNGYQKNVFTKGDSLKVISAGIKLPEAFTFWQDLATGLSMPILSIVPEGVTSGHLYTNPNFTNGYQYIPFENFENVFDAFLNCKDSTDPLVPGATLLTENFYLRVYLANVQPVSMLNVPALWNAKRFYVAPFCKVLHTIPLA